MVREKVGKTPRDAATSFSAAPVTSTPSERIKARAESKSTVSARLAVTDALASIRPAANNRIVNYHVDMLSIHTIIFDEAGEFMGSPNMIKSARLGLFALACALASAGAHAQVFKCTDDSGNVSFTDRPCASSQKSETVTIEPAPVQPEEARRLAEEKENERRQRQAQRERAEREALDQRVADTHAKVKKIKSDNYDLDKCRIAREKMAAMRKRDPITYNLDVSYFEYQQAAELYCGN